MIPNNVPRLPMRSLSTLVLYSRTSSSSEIVMSCGRTEIKASTNWWRSREGVAHVLFGSVPQSLLLRRPRSCLRSSCGHVFISLCSESSLPGGSTFIMAFLAVLAVMIGVVQALPPGPAPTQQTLGNPLPGQPRLQFNEHGTFKIASFHDLHYGEVWTIISCSCLRGS